ncbi:MAG: hypothetical protein JW841_15285 [Deltaproteobacteria bacterium]|nr:hypothetical protein [Deltaproteobacteria bacterium]
MSGENDGFVDADHLLEPKDTTKDTASKIKRIYPLDKYTIPNEILQYTDKHHFLKVPLLGQHNPIANIDKWCGRTSAVMVWNYYQRVFGKVNAKTDYITHWRGSSGSDYMDLRHPESKDAVAMSGSSCSPFALLESIKGMEIVTPVYLPKEQNNAKRLSAAQSILSSFKGQTDAFAPIISALEDNNPIVLYTGLSNSYGGHIIAIAGYCVMRDIDGTQKLWFLIADPSRPKMYKGPRLTPLHENPDKALKILGQLDEQKHFVIPIINGDWTFGKGYLYLMRVKGLFMRNTNQPNEQAIWLDDLCNNYIGGKVIIRHIKTPDTAGLVLSKGVRGGLSFPFQQDISVLDSVAAGYYKVEAANTGFYPLGINRALHGGVHWPVPEKSKDEDKKASKEESKAAAFVHSMAPGYIVAARISKSPAKSETKKFLQHDTGFVLVRHDIIKFDAKNQKDVGERLPFYSLYMHMMPTDWPNTLSDVYKDVPWLQQFYLARYAAVVNLNTNDGNFGQIMWANKAVNPKSDSKASVHDSLSDLSKSKDIDLHQGQLALGYVKKPPGDLAQGFAALQHGAVVTFSAPLLQVNHGDILGVVKGKADEKNTTIHGALHWEVFAPANSESALKELLNYASSTLVLEASDIVETGADKKDNLVDADEAKKLLADKLPEEDQKHVNVVCLAADKKYSLDIMAQKLQKFMHEQACFYERPQKEPQYLEPEFTIEKYKKIDLKVQCYPLNIKIDTTKYPVKNHSKRPMPYMLKVQYFASVADADANKYFAITEKELSESDFKAKEIKLDLLVPALTETIKIVTPNFYLNLLDAHNLDAQLALAKRLFGARWRGLFLQHVSEWCPGGIKDLIPKLRDLNLLPKTLKEIKKDDEAAAKVLDTSWYGVPQCNNIKKIDIATPEEVPIVGKQGKEVSLFKGNKAMLPTTSIANHNGSAEVLDAHPTSFLWLLNYVIKDQKYRLIDKRDPINADAEGEHDPVMWGFGFSQKGPYVVGQKITAIVIECGWSNNELIINLENNDKQAPLKKFQFDKGKYEQGVLTSSRTLPVWGEYTLKIEGYKGNVEKQAEADLPITIALMSPQNNELFQFEKDDKTGFYKFTLHFSTGCPQRLNGYFTFEHAKFTLPNNIPQASSWVVDGDSANYIIDLKKGVTKVTNNFTLANYFTAEGSEDKIAIALCIAIELFIQSFKKSLLVLSLTNQGNEVVFEPHSLPPQGIKDYAKYKTLIEKVITEVKVDGVAFEFAEAIKEYKKKTHIIKKKTFSIKATYNQKPKDLVYKKLEQCLPIYGNSFGDTPEIVAGYIKQIKRKDVKNVQLQDHFSFNQFSDVVGKKQINLHTQLVARLEKLFVAHKKEKGGHKWIKVCALDPNGLVVAIVCGACESFKKGKSREQARQRFADCAKNLQVEENGKSVPAFNLVEQQRLDVRWPHKKSKATVLVLGITEPELNTTGAVDFVFDPREAFYQVLKDANPTKDERVLIKASFSAFNGDASENFEGTTAAMVDIPKELEQKDSLHAKADNIFKTLAQPRIGTITPMLRMTNLVLLAPLMGAKNDWLNAKPTYFIAGEAVGTTYTSSASGGARSSISIPLINKKGQAIYLENTPIKVELKTTNPDAQFDDERIQIESATLDVDVTPKLVGPLEAEAMGDNYLHFSAPVYCCDVESLALSITAKTDTGAITEAKSNWRKTKGKLLDDCLQNIVIVSGDVDLNSTYTAKLALVHLIKGNTYHFELAAKKDDKILGFKVENKLECDFTYTTEEN